MKLLFIPIILSFITIATADTIAVLDTDGDVLKPGIEYYIVPGITDVAGGLTLASRNGSCPLSVAQAPRGGGDGFPVIFTPANPNAKTVNIGEDTNIAFSAVTICIQSTVWRLTGPDEVSKWFYVSTGGVTGNPGKNTLSNWFKIEQYMGVYKLVFCPGVCDVCRPVCGDLTIDVVGDQRWLALSRGSERAFPFMFKKA